jgi:tripartite-type tricarboxylate transporter receptor subunit TctC
MNDFPGHRWFFVVAALAAALLSQSAGAGDFYAGKSITFIVGSGVGGGYDLQARLASRHLGKHIPGRPSIVVQNMPAAGGIAACNHIYNTAPPDGTVIALAQRNVLVAKLTYPGGTRFEMERFHWLASLNSETAVALAWNETAPHRTTKDLFEKELIVGGVNGADPEITPRLYNALIGTKFKVVTGYTTTAQVALAMERGEVQGIADWSWSSIKSVRPTWLRDNKVTLLLQGALNREPELGGLPSALDYVKDAADRKTLELHFTQKLAARPVIAPPGVPPDRVALLRAAFEALRTDPDFLADAERSRQETGIVPGEEIDAVVKLVASTPPEITDRYAKAFAPERKP